MKSINLNEGDENSCSLKRKNTDSIIEDVRNGREK